MRRESSRGVSLPAGLVLLCLACADPGPKTAELKSPGGPAAPREPVQIALSPELHGAASGVSASWLAYALSLVATLEARESESVAQRDADYAGELRARSMMLDIWQHARAENHSSDGYLDALLETRDAGYLEEYVAVYLLEPGWTLPAAEFGGLDLAGFETWSATHLPRHVPRTLAEATPENASPQTPLPGETIVLFDTPEDCPRVAEVQRSLESWQELEPRLGGVAISAPTQREFLASLSGPGAPAEVRTRGATWVSPKVGAAHYFAGFCAVNRGDWPAALDWLRAATRLTPRAPMVRLELAMVLTQTREHEAADGEIETVLGISENPCVRAAAWRKRGFLRFEAGAFDTAYDAYAESLRFEPRNANALAEMKLIREELRKRGRSAPADFTPPAASVNVIRCEEQ